MGFEYGRLRKKNDRGKFPVENLPPSKRHLLERRLRLASSKGLDRLSAAIVCVHCTQLSVPCLVPVSLC